MKIIQKIFLVLVVVCFSTALYAGKKKSQKLTTQQKVHQAQLKWEQTYNTDVLSLSNSYYYNSIIVTKEGKLIQGKSEIAHYYQNLQKKEKKIQPGSSQTVYLKKANPFVVYEIGYYVLDEAQTNQYMIIWRKLGRKWYKQVDIVYLKNSDKDVTREIDAAENEWEKLAKEGSPIKLLHELYWENAVFNPPNQIYQGYDALVPQFGFVRPNAVIILMAVGKTPYNVQIL